MSEKLTLYYVSASMPARAVLLLCRNLGIDVDVKVMNLVAGDQHTEEFKKLNPVSKIPVIVDTDGFVLSESRAILAYLVNTRKPESALYPSDPKKRALVDQRLYFDATEVFSVIRALVRPVFFDGVTEISQKVKDEAKAFMNLLEIYLNDSEYFAGSEMTIADISILTNVTSMSEFGFDFSENPKVTAWYKKMQTIPGFEENLEGAKSLVKLVIETIGKNVF